MDQTTAPAESTADVDEVDPEVQAGVDAAVARVEAMCAADSDLVHGDVVEQVALDQPVEVAVELCRQTMNFIPDTVRRMVFEAEHAETIRAAAEETAQRDAVSARAQQRSARAAATRAATLAAEAAAETAAIRSATCPHCFQVRSPSGVCGCDE